MIRVRKWVAAAVVGAAGLGVSACNNSLSGPGNSGGTGAAAAPADVGPPLYKVEPMPAAEKVVVTPEPIVIPNAVVQSDVRVQVAAQVDGTIELIATPLPPGAKYDPNDPEIVFHPRDKEKAHPYYRLRANQPVTREQILARLDEQLVAIQKAASEEVMRLSDESIAKNKIAADAYKKQLDTYNTTLAPSSSAFERLGLVATVARLDAEVVGVQREKAKAMGEYQSANAQLARYWVVSKLNGRVTRLLKSPSEYAKAGEPILEIQTTDRVRIEGKLDVQYANRVRKGMRVTVEPSRPVDPEPLSINHRMEVTAVAVTAHPGRPLIASAGLDASVLVWDATATKQYHRLGHPAGVGVRAVACTTKPAGPQYLVSGAEDGKVRLWDVTNPDKLPAAPVSEFDAAHESAVTAAAFSPDGRFLATAAGRDIYVWSVAEKKKLYALPSEHRDAVTAVRFTPQATLVTVSRDKSIRSWKLGEKGAAADKVIDHRGGSVDVLGVSSDGAQVLFDKSPDRLDVVSLADERPLGSIISPTGGARFATLALYSADNKTIATVGGDVDQKGELTLWDAPTPGGRGAERRRLVTPRGVPITCAAASPDPDKRFVAVGTSLGGVYFWTLAAGERAQALSAEVVFVQQDSPRTILVQVELPNPTGKSGDGLQERSLATIIIDPTAPMPAAAAIPPAGPVVPAGGVVPATVGIIQAGGLEKTGGGNAPVLNPPAPMAPVAAPPGATAPAPASGSVIPPVTAPPLPEKK